jgi:hypothetical protein
MTPVPSDAGRSITWPGAEAADDVVRDRALGDGHLDHALLRLLDPLADRLRHLVRLAETEADAAVRVADDDQRAEAEAPAALHDLRDAVDVNDLLLELDAAVVDDPPLARSASHLGHSASFPLELEAALAGAFGHRFHAAVVQKSVAIEDDARDALLLAAARDELADFLRRVDGRRSWRPGRAARA